MAKVSDGCIYFHATDKCQRLIVMLRVSHKPARAPYFGTTSPLDGASEATERSCVDICQSHGSRCTRLGCFLSSVPSHPVTLQQY
jgi:hypothetical protein